MTRDRSRFMLIVLAAIIVLMIALLARCDLFDGDDGDSDEGYDWTFHEPQMPPLDPPDDPPADHPPTYNPPDEGRD